MPKPTRNNPKASNSPKANTGPKANASPKVKSKVRAKPRTDDKPRARTPNQSVPELEDSTAGPEHPGTATVPQEADGPSPVVALDHAPTEKTCAACATTLPERARFCSRCGEPQLPGLRRPEPLLKAPATQAEEQARAASPGLAMPPPASPAQVTVPSTPKTGVVRSGSAAVVPVLALERPIPASLLNPEAALAMQAGLVLPDSPPSSPGNPAADGRNAQHGAPEQALDQAVATVPAQAQPPAASTVSLETRAPAPLFDVATESRILALRAGREIMLERVDRLMGAFKLKPKPRSVATKPKARPKDDKASEKGPDKPKAKASKGH